MSARFKISTFASGRFHIQSYHEYLCAINKSCILTKHTVTQHFSNFNMHINHVRILLKGKSGFSRSGEGLRVWVSNKPLVKAAAEGLDHTRCHARQAAVGVAGSNPSPPTSVPLHVKSWTEWGLIFYGSSSPQIHLSWLTQCTGNLHNSEQHKSLPIKVLLQNWDSNKKPYSRVDYVSRTATEAFL